MIVSLLEQWMKMMMTMMLKQIIEWLAEDIKNSKTHKQASYVTYLIENTS